MSQDLKLHELIEIVQLLHARGHVLATGGNFSVKNSASSFLVSSSGVDKGKIKPSDFLQMNLDGTVQSHLKPSAETLVHLAIYLKCPKVACVLHGHGVQATVFSKLEKANYYEFFGYEMQKSIAGNTTHLENYRLPLFENTQDMEELKNEIIKRWPEVDRAKGLLIKGHGLYAFGENCLEAKRHYEGIDFLIQCEILKRQIQQ